MLIATYFRHILKFRFEAGTSRGILTERNTYFIKLHWSDNPSVVGEGEASPLYGLSIDFREDFEEKLKEICKNISEISFFKKEKNPNNTSKNDFKAISKNLEWIYNLVPAEFPSIIFALETAFLDLENGGKRIIFDNDFAKGQKKIKINGLIWMGKMDFMRKQIQEKLALGFSCLKLKIGAINFEDELQILQDIRSEFSSKQITLRVDANGAFEADKAMDYLEKLSKFQLHSIEQPIKPRQYTEMAHLCKNSPLSIALDEELIGVFDKEEKKLLLQKLQPPFIILKPTLLGGFYQTNEWIEIAEELNINWWVTSALEANIGLNAVCQFTAQYPYNLLPQGLGTGALYENNVETKLYLRNEWIRSHNLM